MSRDTFLSLCEHLGPHIERQSTRMDFKLVCNVKEFHFVAAPEEFFLSTRSAALGRHTAADSRFTQR